MDLNDFEVLGKLIEKEFDIRYIGISRIHGNPMFLSHYIPKLIEDNFECYIINGVLILENINHEHLECLHEIKKLHEKLEKLEKWCQS